MDKFEGIVAEEKAEPKEEPKEEIYTFRVTRSQYEMLKRGFALFTKYRHDKYCNPDGSMQFDVEKKQGSTHS